MPDALPGDLAAYLDEVERAILLRALEKASLQPHGRRREPGTVPEQIRYRMARLGITAGD